MKYRSKYLDQDSFCGTRNRPKRLPDLWITLFCLATVLNGCSKRETVIDYGPTNADFQSRPKPINDTDYRDDIADGMLVASATVEDKLSKVLDDRVSELESFIQASLTGDTLSPAWFAPDLVAMSVDRKNFKSTYSGERIQIARWRPSSETPNFLGKSAVFRSIQTNFMPWINADDTRVSVQVFTTTFQPRKITAQLLVEVFGNSDSKSGRCASAVWETDWRIDEFHEQISLTKVVVRGQEEVYNLTRGGELFRDCTGWIMKGCPSYDEQLAIGLDQWALRIPGLDISGNLGIAVGDVNSDGLDDIYFAQPHGLPNLVFIQQDDGSVDEMGALLGVDILDDSRGVLIVDLDNDGDQDIVVCTDDALILLSQTPDGKFQVEHQLSIGCDALSISSADFDQDGDLDLYLCKYQPIEKYADIVPHPNSLANSQVGGRNVLLRNDQGWKFTDVTEQVGLGKDNHWHSRSATWLDYDLDGDQDLYVTNEYNRDNLLQNQGGSFTDVIEQMNMVRPAKHRTVSCGEFNQDGRPDMFVGADVPMKARQLVKLPAEESDDDSAKALLSDSLVWYSGGEIQYQSYTFPGPIFSCQSTNSSAAVDVNNDGLEDLIVTNGLFSRPKNENVEAVFYRNIVSQDQDVENDAQRLSSRIEETHSQISNLCRAGYSFCSQQSNRCYLNIGRSGFSNISPTSGLDFSDDSRSIATTDWDHDGDVDVIMSSRNGPQLRILTNQLKSPNKFIHFSLVGTHSNRDAIGARVEVFLHDRRFPLVKTISAGSGFLSQSSKKLHFGLGTGSKIQKVDVIWPDGAKQTFRNLVPNTEYTIVEGQNEAAEVTNERFQQVSIKNQAAPVAGNRNPFERAVFYPPFDLPILEFHGGNQEYFAIETYKETPLLVLFWTDDLNSKFLLQEFSDSALMFVDNHVDVLAVFVDQSSRPANEDWHIANRLVEQTTFPFRWGTAALSTITKLKELSGAWFYRSHLTNIPFAILIDSQQRVRVCYSGKAISARQVISDLALCESDIRVTRDLAAGRKGLWLARYRSPRYRRLISVLDKLGFKVDAELLTQKSTSQSAAEIAHLGLESQSQGDPQKARDLFEQAIEIDSNCILAYVGHGQLLLEASRRENGKKAKQQLLDDAADNFDNASSRDRLNSQAIIGRANVAYATGNTEDALQQLKSYLEIDPQRYEIHALVGRLSIIQQDYVQATSYLKEAFENRPSLPNVAVKLGDLYLHQGQYQEARQILQRAHRLQPNDADVLRSLAEAEFQNRNFERAVELAKLAIQKDPTDVQSQKILAWLYATCPYKNYRDGVEGVRLARKLFDHYGENPFVLEIFAACLAEKGDFVAAIKFQERAAERVNVENARTAYSSEQLKGLNTRLNLYRRKRPYRTADMKQIPVEPSPLM